MVEWQVTFNSWMENNKCIYLVRGAEGPHKLGILVASCQDCISSSHISPYTSAIDANFGKLINILMLLILNMFTILKSGKKFDLKYFFPLDTVIMEPIGAKIRI
jgi:hypothetical protein